MKKIFLLSLLVTFFTTGSLIAQVCNPNPIFVQTGIPGFFPIANQGLPDGEKNVPYSETITVVVPADTTVDLSALTGFPGLPTVTVDVNYLKIASLSGLPNGLSYACDNSNCQWDADSSGCLSISGTPTQGGTYTVGLEGSLNITLPNTVPPPFGGNPFDLPLAGQNYDLFVDAPTATTGSIEQSFSLGQSQPNPVTNTATFTYTLPQAGEATLSLINLNGAKVWETTVTGYAGENTYKINTTGFAEGLYLYSLEFGEVRLSQKLMIRR